MASFVFETSGQDPDQSATPAQQIEFQSDFARELERLQTWAQERKWNPLAVLQFHVTVSDKFRISKALFPAWSGCPGHMEFPTWRVIARTAAITHELTHVFFPNGNRFLAEGLAVFIQAEIGSNPAFPNFGRPLHELVRERLQDMCPEFSYGGPESLDQVHLSELDKIATPSPLVLKVGDDLYGEEPRGQASIYPIAGSFVQFLIETYGWGKFRETYSQTSLIPFEQNAGPPDRWLVVYDAPLQDLEQEWKTTVVARSVAGSDVDADGDQ